MTDTANPETARRDPHDIDLTIRLTEAPGAPEYTFRLEAGDGAPSAASTLPDPAAAPNVDVRLWSTAVSQSLMALRVLPGLRIPQADGYLDDLSKGRAAALAGKAPEAALHDVATSRGHTLLELAFAWLTARPAIASVIAGATSPAQIAANVAAVDWTLSAEDLAAVDAALSAA